MGHETYSWTERKVMAKTDEILTELRAINLKLYGEGEFQGDIPDIKGHLEKLNGHLDDHSKRLVTVETKVEERTVSKISKKAMLGYGGGGILVIITLVLQLYQLLT